MGMVIQHNISAMNANNAMTRNVSGLGKSTEKLSTGYQINRAADNAAGLAISEKMRSQIRGLAQATNNANDAISLIQTAEGGLQETEDILQRMRELSVQSANGTYTDEDREQIQHEVDALKAEIDRIAESTEFNEMKLLDGSLDGATGSTGEYGARYGAYLSAKDTAKELENGNKSLEGSTITSSVSGVTIKLADKASGAGGENAEWDATGTTLTLNLKLGQTYTQAQIDDLIKNATQAKGDATTKQTQTPSDVDFNLKNGVFTFDTADETYTTSAGARASSCATDGQDLSKLLMQGTSQNDTYADAIKFTANNYGEDARKIEILTDVEAGKEWVEVSASNNEGTGVKDGEYKLHLSTGVEYSEQDIEKLLAKSGLDYDVTLSDAKTPDGDVKLFAQTAVTTAGNGVVVEMSKVKGSGVGADKALGSGEGLTFQIGANGVEDQRLTVNIADMSSTALGVGGLDISTQDGANDGINKIDDAIKTVSSQRAKLGAVQNRLEHTVNSLSTAEENLQSAESQIRDTDMASEMIKYTKSNILQQASQSMLAQANQQPQGVLQLLG